MKTILLADDSAAIRNILKTSLYEEFELMEAENGVKALEAARLKDVDLFILDVNMPEMDGITLVKELRKQPQYTKTPIIMLTTESRDDKKQQGRDAGANGWILKPCDADRLTGVVKKLLHL